MDTKTKIVIADDHELIRKGVHQIFSNKGSFEIVEAVDGEDAITKIRMLEPHVAILDIEMPKLTGFDVAEKIHQESLNTSVIILTMHCDEQLFNRAMDIGVMGFVLKENTVSEIVRCMDKVLDGKHYLSPEISEFLICRNNNLVSNATDKQGLHLLTETEKKVLKEVGAMKTSQEIADHFGVSIKTVQNHRSNICAKLQISGTHALLKFAIEHSKKI